MKTEILMVGLDLDGTVFNNNKELQHIPETFWKRQSVRDALCFLPPEDRKSDFRKLFWRSPVWNMR